MIFKKGIIAYQIAPWRTAMSANIAESVNRRGPNVTRSSTSSSSRSGNGFDRFWFDREVSRSIGIVASSRLRWLSRRRVNVVVTTCPDGPVALFGWWRQRFTAGTAATSSLSFARFSDPLFGIQWYQWIWEARCLLRNSDGSLERKGQYDNELLKYGIRFQRYLKIVVRREADNGESIDNVFLVEGFD